MKSKEKHIGSERNFSNQSCALCPRRAITPPRTHPRARNATPQRDPHLHRTCVCELPQLTRTHIALHCTFLHSAHNCCMIFLTLLAPHTRRAPPTALLACTGAQAPSFMVLLPTGTQMVHLCPCCAGIATSPLHALAGDYPTWLRTAAVVIPPPPCRPPPADAARRCHNHRAPSVPSPSPPSGLHVRNTVTPPLPGDVREHTFVFAL